MNCRTIQRLLLPEKGEENHGLYYHGTDGVKPADGEVPALWVPSGEKADLFTYFNGFYPEQWKQYTQAEDFYVTVTLKGSGRLTLTRTDGKRTVSDEKITFDFGEENKILRFQMKKWQNSRACWIALEGREPGACLIGASVEAKIPEPQSIRMAVVICTCRREREVLENLRRISRLGAESRPEVFLIDNGNTLKREEIPSWVRFFPNKNCGGAGGFTRGIMEVMRDPSFTHVVLMDDDIILEPGVFEKTVLFLSALKSEWRDSALAGSLIEKEVPWRQFECGALWNRGLIRAGRSGVDLRDRRSLLYNAKRQKAEYGGWWYCCIPVSVIRMKGLPLPLFIHRDDIEYGLRIGKVMTLNGVGVWHEAVTRKLSQAGEYYDIRNMAIVNSIHVPDFGLREWKRFLMKWTAGNLLRGRYDYIYLNICGMLDFLKGEKWLEETDALKIHRRIAERIPKLSPAEPGEKGVFYTTADVSVYTAARKRHIVYEEPSGLCLRADKSPAKALRLSVYFLLTLLETDRYFEKARKSYYQNWKKLTTGEFWNQYLETGNNYEKEL